MTILLYKGDISMIQMTFPAQNAHGPVRFNMTNDYMFRAVLQTNNKVLRGLICSLLHLDEKDVLSVEITNPIILGESIKSKEIRLDINVRLVDRGRGHILVNLEMQVADRLDWQNRSLIYLCRSFDQLDHGQKYIDAMPVIHIGILDYPLFPSSPEFYATYKLMNVKNYSFYSDNLTLSVVNLSQTDLATEEDKKYQIDCWARFLRAATWEEIHMLASKNPYIQEASNSIFLFNTEEQIRKECLDREEYHREIRTYKKIIRENEKTIAEKDALLQKTVAENNSTIQELRAENERLRAAIKSQENP